MTMDGKLARLTILCCTLMAAPSTQAAGRFIDDIRVSRRAQEATISIELACPMRFQSELSTEAGMLLEIRVAPLDACRQLGVGRGLASEIYRPVGGQLAHLIEVQYESLGLGDNLLILRFDRPVDYRVTQRANLRTLRLAVTADDAAAQRIVAAPRNAEAAPATQPSARSPAVRSGRAPLSVRIREPGVNADHIVNLQSTRELADPSVVEAISLPPGLKLYVSETTVNGQTWYRLRLGFFGSEAAAREALESLTGRFPRAWVGRAERDEVEFASNYEFDPGSVVHASIPQDESLAVAVAPSQTGTLGAQRIGELQAEAHDNLLTGDFEGAIRIYTRLLQEPGPHRPEAREYLGVARERNGQVAHARAEYQAFLRDFPSADGTQRVQQRLSGLLLAGETPREPLRAATTAGRDWDIRTGVSQYYRRDVNEFVANQGAIVTLSALFTDIDFSVQHSGNRFDTLGRVSLSHFYDMRAEDQNRRSDQSRYSYAYLDLHDAQKDWSLRVGRQTLHNGGVLGRFDGAHFSYDFAPDRRVHYTTGYPVESTRNSTETGRQFHGIAVDFDRLVGEWDVSAFINQQTIEGIDDRRAIGIETRYVDDRRTFTSLLDYEFDYGEINTALVLGTWRLPNRLTLSALFDRRMSPVLTTRNALIGQPVTTIEELLLVWTEEEVRQLARDRTSSSTTVTLGLARPLGQKFQLNADVTVTEYEATAESSGVLAVPGTGQQTYYSTSLVGSGVFGSRDVSIVSLRYGESESFDISQLTWDARFPIGQRLRLNPRLRLSSWRGRPAGRTRETISPSFRLLLNTRNHYRLEVEIGANQFVRTDTNGEQESSGYFLNLGYRADF